MCILVPLKPNDLGESVKALKSGWMGVGRRGDRRKGKERGMVKWEIIERCKTQSYICHPS